MLNMIKLGSATRIQTNKWLNSNFHFLFVQNPDGTLSKAAMMQSALAKERREMKQTLDRAESENIPTGMNKNWIDPMPDSKWKTHPTPVTDSNTS